MVILNNLFLIERAWHTTYYTVANSGHVVLPYLSINYAASMEKDVFEDG